VNKVIQLSRLEEKIEASIRGSSEPRFRPNVLNVSELPFCHKKAYLMRKANIGSRLNGMMLSGTLFHEKIPKYLAKIKEFKNARYEISCNEIIGDLQIRGRADVVTDDCVYEFKYSAVKTGLDNIPANHMLQGNAYANMLDIKKYVIAVINSFKLTPVLLEFKRDKKEYAKFCDDAVKLNDCINNDVFPEKGPSSKRECQYCPVRHDCEQMRLLEEYANLPELEVML